MRHTLRQSSDGEVGVPLRTTPDAEGGGASVGEGPTSPRDSAPPHVRSGRAEQLTYARYLRIDDLIDLQQDLTGVHDEMQFIIVHQVCELWFKLLLFELKAVRAAMQAVDLRTASRLLRRSNEILKNFIATIPLLETMRPADFMKIRSELGSASGFQSRQFRQIEFISGAKDQRYARAHEADPRGQASLQAALEEPTLWDAFVGLLKQKGYSTNDDAEIVRALVAIHEEDRHPALDMLIEGLLEYDLLFVHWRTRHILMVERIIGARPGTGQQEVNRVVGDGYTSMASGTEYLKTTLSKRFFPLIWQARTGIKG
jgi:tryptophan 2,3-dioxygenase